MNDDHRVRAVLEWEVGLEYVPDVVAIPPLLRSVRPKALAPHHRGLIILDATTGGLFLVAGPRCITPFSGLRSVTSLCRFGEQGYLVSSEGRLITLDANGKPGAILPAPGPFDFISCSRLGRLLGVHTEKKAVVEFTVSGEITWKIDEASGLLEPRSAELNRDRTGCIIADDRANAILEAFFGKLGTHRLFGGPSHGKPCRYDLFSPKHASVSAQGILISDSYNCRVIEIDDNGRLLPFEIGSSRSGGSGERCLWRPVYSLERTQDDILIVDKKNGQILSVDRTGRMRAEFGTPTVKSSQLRLPRSVQPLPSGRDLIVANTHANEIVRVCRGGVAQIETPPFSLFWPRCAVVAGGRLYISDSRNGRLLFGPYPRSRSCAYSKIPTSLLDDPHEIFPVHQTDTLLVTNTNANSIEYIHRTTGRSFPIQLEEPLCDPHSAIRTASGALIICDTGHNRLVVKRRDGYTYNIDQVTFPNGEALMLKEPRHVCAIGNNHILITDTGMRGLVMTDFNGRGVFSLSGRDCIESGEAYLYLDGPSFLYDPRWAALGPDDLLYVGDTGNNRVLAIRLPPNILPSVRAS